MLFMNEYDLSNARSRFAHGQTVNRLTLAIAVDGMRQWADSMSDGWAHWPKAAQAARRAMEHIESRTTQENRLQETTDIDERDVVAALRPMRSLMTRHDVPRDVQELILTGQTSGLWQ